LAEGVNKNFLKVLAVFAKRRVVGWRCGWKLRSREAASATEGNAVGSQLPRFGKLVLWPEQTAKRLSSGPHCRVPEQCGPSERRDSGVAAGGQEP
jgi:hypothetical protein